MHATDVSRQGEFDSIQYIDRWGVIDYIGDNVDLCDKAGCRCDGAKVICDSDDSHHVFFVDARQSYGNCDCQPMPEEVAQDPNRVEVGDVNLIVTPGRPSNVVSRLTLMEQPLVMELV